MQNARIKVIIMVTALILQSFMPSAVFADSLIDVAGENGPTETVGQSVGEEAELAQNSKNEAMAVVGGEAATKEEPNPAVVTKIPTEGVVAQSAANSGAQEQSSQKTEDSVQNPAIAAQMFSRGDIVISAVKFDAKGGFAAIELENKSSGFVDLSDTILRMKYVAALDENSEKEYQCEVKFGDRMYAKPKSALVLQKSGLYSSSGDTLEFSGCEDIQGGVIQSREIAIYQKDLITELVLVSSSDLSAAQLDAVFERKKDDKTFKKAFAVRADGKLYTNGFYEPPIQPEIAFLEILPNPKSCAVSDLSLTCGRYVKVKNIGKTSIDLAYYRLRSGSQNTNSTSSNTSALEGVIEPGEIFIITNINLNKDAGTVWLQDRFGLINFSNDITPYEKAGNVGNTGRSWDFDSQSSSWQWAVPNPGSEDNVFIDLDSAGKGSISTEKTYAPCPEGQYRHPETKRCRLIESSKSSTLKPCKEGQYRSEETNRCRSIVSTVSAALKPCPDGQFRNPETNRCKKIASTDDILEPCKDGWERNPETNRCRKIRTASSTVANYPVEPIVNNSSNPAIVWTVVALVAAGLGYAVWEWRSEIGRAAAKLLRIGRRK